MGVKDPNFQLFNKGDVNEEFDFYLAWDVQSPDFKRMSEKWTAIIQAAQSLDREGVIDWSALCTAFVSTIDPNIAERIIRPAQQGQQQIVQDEQQDLAQIFAGIPKNIKPGTPPPAVPGRREAQGGVTVQSLVVNNPAAERASDTLPRTVRKLDKLHQKAQ